MSARRIFARPARFAVIAPYVWMVLFFLVPFGFVLKISLSQTAIAQPPYTPVFDLTEGLAAIKAAFALLSLDNFKLLISDNLYILSYLRSLVVAVTSTVILLLIGYPIAYGMARLPQRWQSVAMMLGQRLGLDFFPTRDWRVAAATAIALLVLLVPPLLLYDGLQRRQLEGAG